jgi:hypothetical protein
MRTDNVMDTPEQAAAVYRSEMRRLLDVVDGIPSELLATPIHGDWTINEVLVHLAGWDRAVAASADDVRAGRPAGLTAMRLEDINDDLVEAHRGASLEDTRRELEEAHRELLARLTGVSREDWVGAVADARWPDGSAMTLGSVFGYRFRGQTHYGGHADELEEWLRSRREERE